MQPSQRQRQRQTTTTNVVSCIGPIGALQLLSAVVVVRMIGTRIPMLMMMMMMMMLRLLLPFAQAAPLSKPFIAYRTNPYGQTVHHSVHWEHLQLEQQAEEEKVAQKRQRPGAAVQQEPHCTRNGTVPEANCLA
jgi:hypothetical protein